MTESKQDGVIPCTPLFSICYKLDTDKYTKTTLDPVLPDFYPFLSEETSKFPDF